MSPWRLLLIGLLFVFAAPAWAEVHIIVADHETRKVIKIKDDGNTLICASTEDAVIEVDKDKKVVWRYELPFPYLATRLPNGNTLISSGNGYGSPTGFFVIEVDKDGKTVWKYGGDDAPADQK